MKQRSASTLLVSGFLLVSGCLRDGDRLAGNGSEVENGIHGAVYLPDASTVPGAVVTLYPADFNPFADAESDLPRDTTDEAGRYSFSARPDGPYHIEARWSSGNMGALAIQPDADTLILSATGSISFGSKGSDADVFIPGTGLRAASGSAFLPAVPAGIFSLLSRTRDTLAQGIPVSADHNTQVPSRIVRAGADTYLESAEPDQNSGAKQFLRLKSGGQGFILLHFDLDSTAAYDSATLWLAVSEFQRDFVDYSYDASLFGFTASWREGTGYDQEDLDDGSTYRESEPGLLWPDGVPEASLDSASRIDVAFRGVRGGQIKHPFPVSGALLRGLQAGTYTAIALVENSERYNNVDFSSSEGYATPELFLHEEKR